MPLEPHDEFTLISAREVAFLHTLHKRMQAKIQRIVWHVARRGVVSHRKSVRYASACGGHGAAERFRRAKLLDWQGWTTLHTPSDTKCGNISLSADGPRSIGLLMAPTEFPEFAYLVSDFGHFAPRGAEYGEKAPLRVSMYADSQSTDYSLSRSRHPRRRGCPRGRIPGCARPVRTRT